MKNRVYINLVLLALALLLTQCQQNTFSEIGGDNMQAHLSARNTKQNPMFPTAPAESSVSGEYMQAFLVAYNAFKDDPLIPDQKRKVENYEISFRQDSEAYFIFFGAKRLPSERNLLGGESELGKDVTYAVRKKDYKIIARQFYK